MCATYGYIMYSPSHDKGYLWGSMWMDGAKQECSRISKECRNVESIKLSGGYMGVILEPILVCVFEILHSK